MGCTAWLRGWLRLRIGRGHAMAPARGQRRGGGGGRLRVCKPPPSLAREGRAADSPAGQFDGLRRTHPLCAVSSSSPGLRIQGPGLQNPRGHGLPCAAPGRTVGSSGGLTQSGGCSKRRSIPATVPAAPTPLARSAPPARCPGPISGTIYHVPLLRSPTTTPEPLPLLPLCPTALYHAMLWYTPSMRTRVPSFGQTFPNKVGPCQKRRSSCGRRQSNGDARVVMRGSSHHSSGFSPYLSPGRNCDTRLARTHTHREDMEKEDWVA